MFKFIILLFIISISPLKSAEICHSSFEDLPTLSGGRIKPLGLVAKESLKFLQGNGSIIDFCKLSFESLGVPSQLDLKITIDHQETKALLGMNANDNFLSFSRLIEQEQRLRESFKKMKIDSPEKKDLKRTLAKIDLMMAIKEGRMWKVPEVTSTGEVSWLILPEYLTEQRVLKEKNNNPFLSIFHQAKSDFDKTGETTYLLEKHYFKVQYFMWALLLSLLAIIFGVTLKKNTLFFSTTLLSILIQIIAMSMRVLISGRAPVTNMYETVMFSGFGALILGLFLTLYSRKKIFLLSGLVMDVLCLMMMKLANNMLDPSISPLVPVLRDNFWLSTHVTTIILSYGALALSWVLANIILGQQAFSSISSKDLKEKSDLIYTCIKFGVVLLAVGIILGGIWADYSWGRFWGWDPKEVGSLIVLLIYMAILHGRYTQWINPQRFIYCTAGAFLSVMMAWFGVNYILAAGLHSYGFSEGGAVFLGSFTFIQVAFLLISYLRLNLSLSLK